MVRLLVALALVACVPSDALAPEPRLAVSVGDVQSRLEAGQKVIELAEGDHVGDIVIPAGWDGVLRGAGGWFNTKIRGAIIAPDWGRYTLEGLTVTGDVRLDGLYQGVVRDVVVFGEGSSFRLGTPGVNRTSAVILDNLHVIRADSFRVYAADLLVLGGSVERGATDPVFDASADFGGILVLGTRFEHDRRQAVRVRGPHVQISGTTHILSDLVIESGDDVSWAGLVLVLSQVRDLRP